MGLALEAAASAGEVKVPRAAREALLASGGVRLCVLLDSPGPAAKGLAARRASARRTQETFLDSVASLRAGRIAVRYRYRYSPSLLLEARSLEALEALERAGAVRSVMLDVEGSGGLEESLDMVRGREVFDLGVTGEGRVVAVLDTGVCLDHPALAGKVIHQYHFLDQGASVGPGALDGHGHGTHVTGIAASRGTGGPRGMAPGALVVAIKVLDDRNRGWLSDWARGVEHAVDLHLEDNGISIDAINMSLVSGATYGCPCDASFPAFASACAAALEAGIAVFACSGNNSSSREMTSPGCYTTTYSVGCVLDTLPDSLCSFTGRDDCLDLLAPGSPIRSLGRCSGTAVMAGCSMATPHASGLALLLREIDPSVPPAGLIEVMRQAGVPVFDPASGLVFPRLDALAAVSALLDPGDCNGNGTPDGLDVVRGTSTDCDLDRVPDECQIAADPSLDSDGNGLLDRCETPPLPFRRGDANASGLVDLSDAVFIFRHLFTGMLPGPPCAAAADADDSGRLELIDGIFVLEDLFRGGDPLPLPGAFSCGPDPTRDLPCESYGTCG